MLNEEKKRLSEAKDLIEGIYNAAQEKFGFADPAKIAFLTNPKNSSDPLGRTAYYDPENMKVAVYVTGRHIKDILRSLAHELVHHAQNCRGEFENASLAQEGYAQNDEHLREMEKEAYLEGNMLFRDFEDRIKAGRNNDNDTE